MYSFHIVFDLFAWSFSIKQGKKKIDLPNEIQILGPISILVTPKYYFSCPI